MDAGRGAQLAAARAALTRIRLRRAVDRRHAWRGAAVAVLALAVVLVPGSFPLSSLAEVELPRWASLGVGLVLWPFFAVLLVGGALLVPPLLLLLLRLPLLGWSAARGVASCARARRRAARRAEAEAQLAALGRVEGAWAADDEERRAALRELARADAALGIDGQGALCARAAAVPPRDCPDCGAPLGAPGEGLLRCAHCGHERYDPPPAARAALEEGRRILAQVRAGGGGGRSRDALWEALRRAEGLDAQLRRLAKLAVFYGACCALAVGLAVAESSWAYLPLLVGLLGSLAIPPLLALFVGRWLDLRFRRFGPGYRRYEEALAGDIVREVTARGQLGLDELAATLGVARAHVDEVLARLHADGGLPLHHDRERDLLLGAQASAMGTNTCPRCGGDLEPAARGRIVCSHCGGAVSAREETERG